MNTLEGISIGDYLISHFDNGLGGTIIYNQVLKIGKKKIKVLSEYNHSGKGYWYYPQEFVRKVSKEEFDRRNEY